MMDYKQLQVWQKSMDLVIEVCELIESFPIYQSTVLSDQMKRSAIFIPSSIAQGCSGGTYKELLKALYSANSARAELETQLMIADRLKYLSNHQIQTVQAHCREVGEMLTALIQKVRRQSNG